MSFAHLSLGETPIIRTAVPGPKSRELLERQQERESNARTYPRSIPIAVRRTQGATIEDADGNVFLDFWAGAGTANLGHNHPEVVAAAVAQLGLATHTLDLPSAIKDEFTTELLSLLPAPLRGRMKIHFAGPTGADAVEAAMKLAKTATGRRTIVSFQGGYHGMTHGALSVTGLRAPKEMIAGLMPEVHFAPYAYCYRCPIDLRRESCDINCAYAFSSILTDPLSGVTTPAAVILEAVQGEGGGIPADPEFLRRVAEAAQEHNVPVIVDEIQSGFGRTGRMFAFEHAGIEPDIIVLSKALGGGGLPIAVVLYRETLDVWRPGAHVGTFRGFLPAMAAGVVTMRILKERGIPAHAAQMGALLKERLEALMGRYSFIGDVRGLGLMVGVELVLPDGRPATGHARALRHECMQRGLIVELGGRGDAVVRMIPPLIVTHKQVETACATFESACQAVQCESSAA